MENLDFNCSLDDFGIVKSDQPEKEDDGSYKMYGFASSPAKDYDGEQVIQKGLNIEPLINRGWVDWDHDRLKIIGWVDKGDFRDNPNRRDMAKGLYIEYSLNKKDPIARRVWEMAKSLEEVGCPRKFGLSLEGTRKQAKSGKVLAADIYGVAVTPYAKNIETSAHVFMKGLLGASNENILHNEDLDPGLISLPFDEDRFISKISDVIAKAMMAGHSSGGMDQIGFEAMRKESLNNDIAMIDVSEYLERISNDFGIYRAEDRRIIEKLVEKAEKNNNKLLANDAAILVNLLEGYPLSKALLVFGYK